MELDVSWCRAQRPTNGKLRETEVDSASPLSVTDVDTQNLSDSAYKMVFTVQSDVKLYRVVSAVAAGFSSVVLAKEVDDIKDIFLREIPRELVAGRLFFRALNVFDNHRIFERAFKSVLISNFQFSSLMQKLACSVKRSQTADRIAIIKANWHKRLKLVAR